MSEASLVVGRTSAWLASLADFFSPFPPMQSLGLDSEVGCIFKAPLHLVLVQGVVVYTMVPDVLSVTIPY